MTSDQAEIKRLAKVSWELANNCLDILPAHDLSMTGLALVHLVAVWLNAVPEVERVSAYMKWLDTLHVQLDANSVLSVTAVTAALDEPPSQAVH
jgi:hypothetical protein